MEQLVLFFCICASFFTTQSGAQGIGVNYGLLSNELPPPDQAVGLLQSRHIQRVRIFDPNPDVLRALESSNIQVIIGTRNEDLPQLAADPSFAAAWVSNNVVPHLPALNVRCVAAGNEVIPGPLATYVLGAMQNLDAALKAANVNAPVSTALSFGAIGQSNPPSAGTFANTAIMAPIVSFLASHNYPLLVNVYPYFAYIGNPGVIRLDYALASTSEVVVRDGPFKYTNLFDAMVDAVNAALEKVGGTAVTVIVSESGWPSAAGQAATVENAQAYVNNLVHHVTSGSGTPRRSGSPIEAYIFALFNENQKPVGIETNFGMYRHDMTEVYHVDFP